MSQRLEASIREETPADAAPMPLVEPMADAVSEGEDVTQRLADDFLRLAEEFPQFVHPDQLPMTVLDTAAEQGISLLDAYLRYRLQEERKVAAAAEQQRAAAGRSTGSLSGGAIQTPPEQDAFIRAFRSAL